MRKKKSPFLSVNNVNVYDCSKDGGQGETEDLGIRHT
jgi:hypothetical protein